MFYATCPVFVNLVNPIWPYRDIRESVRNYLLTVGYKAVTAVSTKMVKSTSPYAE
jgi:hypothetical protein